MSKKNRIEAKPIKVSKMSLSRCKRELERLRGTGQGLSVRFYQIETRKNILEKEKRPKAA